MYSNIYQIDNYLKIVYYLFFNSYSIFMSININNYSLDTVNCLLSQNTRQMTLSTRVNLLATRLISIINTTKNYLKFHPITKGICYSVLKLDNIMRAGGKSKIALGVCSAFIVSMIALFILGWEYPLLVYCFLGSGALLFLAAALQNISDFLLGLTLNLIRELVEKKSYEIPLDKILIQYYELNKQIVNKLIKWGETTKEFNDNWFKARKNIFKFYLDNLTEPNSTTELNLDNLQLSSLPDIFDDPIFCENLKELDLSFNNLVTLPQSIKNLQKMEKLNISFNQNLEKDNICAKLPFCEIEDIPYINIEPCLQYIYNEINKPVKPLLKIENIPSIKEWIVKLINITDDIPQKVDLLTLCIEYLEAANENDSFRENIFSPIVSDSINTCVDKLLHSLLQINLHYKLLKVDYGDIKKVALLIKGLWIIDELQTIASQKVKSLKNSNPNFKEDVEVYLAYPIKLQKTFSIPIDIQVINFFEYSNLKNEDIEIAKVVLLNAMEDQEELLDFFIKQSTWKEALQFHYPNEFGIMEKNWTDNGDYTSFQAGLKYLTKKAFEETKIFI